MKRSFIFRIDEIYKDKEVKFFLENHLKCSASIISKLKQGEFILLNGKCVTVREKMKQDDMLEIIFYSKNSENIVANNNIKFEILFEDEDILVVNKPAGIPTHPSIKHYTDTLANGIMGYYDGDFMFRAINRLDRETSGIVIVAKNMLSAHILSEQIKRREVKKIYFAITDGVPKNDSGIINAKIAREKESIIKRCIRDDGKDAETIYEILKKNDRYSLVKAEPVTGRTHQIRVHFSHIGCPLYGDNMYGSEITSERVRLHCKEISFVHPIQNKEIKIDCTLPDDFKVF